MRQYCSAVLSVGQLIVIVNNAIFTLLFRFFFCFHLSKFSSVLHEQFQGCRAVMFTMTNYRYSSYGTRVTVLCYLICFCCYFVIFSVLRLNVYFVVEVYASVCLCV